MSTLKQYNSATGKFVPVAYSGRDAESILNSVGDITQLQTTNKTSTVAAINEINDSLVAHKAEIVSQAVTITRDMTLTGAQTVTGFTRKIKRLDIFGCIGGTKRASWGYCIGTNNQCIGYTADGNISNGVDMAIYLGDSGSAGTRATATINADNTVTLTWSHASAGVTGTARIQLVATCHGEE